MRTEWYELVDEIFKNNFFFVDQIAEELKIAKENVKKYETEIENLENEIENCNKPVLTEWSNWSVCSCEGSSSKV